jgi:hypothetical protein
MRQLSPTPTLVPNFDCTVHIVLDDFGKAGRVYREIDEEDAGTTAVIDNLLSGQFNNPVRVVAFNTAEGWSRDVSEDIAWELLRRAKREGKPLSASTRDFVAFHVGEDEALRAAAGLV